MTKLPARQPHRGPRPRKPAATVSVAAAAAVAQGLASRIVAAARELLFESGLPGLTTERLARLAGVSKTSIYKCFPELPLLLETVVAQEAAKITHGLPQEPADASAFRESLKCYGRNRLAMLSRPEMVRLDQLVHQLAGKRPGLGRRFFESMYGHSLSEIRAMLVYGAQRGFIRQPSDPSAEAELLLSMWEGFAYRRARLGIAQRPFPDPQGWAASCVDRLYPV